MPYGLVVDGQLRELGDVKYLLSPQACFLGLQRACRHVQLIMSSAQASDPCLVEEVAPGRFYRGV